MMAHRDIRVALLAAFACFVPLGAGAETYVNQGSLHMDNAMYVSPGLIVNENGGQVQYVEIASHYSVSFSGDPLSQQVLFDYPLTFSSAPSAAWNEPDGAGNLLYVARWGRDSDPYPGTIQNGDYWIGHEFDVEEDLTLDGMASETPYPIPPGALPPDVLPYRQPSDHAQSGNATIVSIAQNLASGCFMEHEAVNEIVKWVDINLLWTLNQPVDAVSVINDPLHRTQCAGFANTAIALLRAVGIPARCLAGTTVIGAYRYWWSLAYSNYPGWSEAGSHAWIEVYFPDVGWVPFDPQGMYNYVDTLYCRSCRGVDSGTCPWYSYGYSWWGPEPELPDCSIWDSQNVDQYGAAFYRCTYSVPYGLIAGQAGRSDLVMAHLVGVPEQDTAEGPAFEIASGSPAGPVMIRYRLPRPEWLSVGVYDIRGRLISSVHEGPALAGAGIVQWAGEDGKGRAVASGIYFVRCRCAEVTLARKVCLLR